MLAMALCKRINRVALQKVAESRLGHLGFTSCEVSSLMSQSLQSYLVQDMLAGHCMSVQFLRVSFFLAPAMHLASNITDVGVMHCRLLQTRLARQLPGRLHGGAYVLGAATLQPVLVSCAMVACSLMMRRSAH